MTKSILIAICIALTFAAVSCETVVPSDVVIIGGADGPTSVFVSSGNDEDTSACTLSLAANVTTGYSWHGFVISGEAVTLDSAEGTYVSDPNPEEMDGVGGNTLYTIRAAAPGQSLIGFSYFRDWESAPTAYDKVMLAYVDENLQLSLMDVTEQGILQGTVISVNEAERSVLISNEVYGEISAVFAEELALPVQGETVNLYTDGTMTCSLPGIVNVLAWESVPGEEAR